MTATTLIFYPETFVGFNKTQLLKRQLTVIGVLGPKFNSSPSFSAGHNFRQYIPKPKSLQKYHSGVIRIQIYAVGIWVTGVDQVAVLDRSNIILIESEAIEPSLDRYAPLCELLYRITGDKYRADITSQPIINSIGEEPAWYG